MMGKINGVILGIPGEQLPGGVPAPLRAHLARSESLSAASQEEICSQNRGTGLPGATGGSPTRIRDISLGESRTVRARRVLEIVQPSLLILPTRPRVGK